MRLRNSAARASSKVVTGTVIASRIGISQACSTGADFERRKVDDRSQCHAPRAQGRGQGRRVHALEVILHAHQASGADQREQAAEHQQDRNRAISTQRRQTSSRSFDHLATQQEFRQGKRADEAEQRDQQRSLRSRCHWHSEYPAPASSASPRCTGSPAPGPGPGPTGP